MLQSEDLQSKFDSFRADLLNAVMQSRERAEIGKVNEEKLKKVDKDLQIANTTRDVLKQSISHLTEIYKNIEKYTEDRRQISLDMLKLAISKAGYIVPDADVNGIELKLDGATAKIVQKGQDVNMREGSAYRTVLSMLIRYTLLKTQPDAMQVIFLDELFGTLSDDTIVLMREYLSIFKEDCLIVGIEQHGLLFNGLSNCTYQVAKTGKVTEIRKL